MYFTSRHFRTTLILYSYLCPSLPRTLFPSGVHTKPLSAFYYLVYTTRSAHCILLGMIALRIFSEQYHIACSSSLYSIPQSLIVPAILISSALGIQIFSVYLSPQSFKCKTNVVKWNWRKLHNNKFQFVPSSLYKMALHSFMYAATTMRRRYDCSYVTSWVEHANTTACWF